jgi:hypothetical protein
VAPEHGRSRDVDKIEAALATWRKQEGWVEGPVRR